MWLKVGIKLHIFLIYFARSKILSLRDHVTFRTWSCACVCEGWMSFWVVFDFGFSILPLGPLLFFSRVDCRLTRFCLSFFLFFGGMESFWWTTFDGLYWWTCIVDDQSTWWSWHLSKGNDVWSSSKCQKIAMWVQFYSCMALDRTCMVESKWELPHFIFLKKNSKTSN